MAAGRFDVEPSFTATNAAGKLLDVRFEHSEQLWPWSGFLALYLRVTDAGAATTATAEGEVSPIPCASRALPHSLGPASLRTRFFLVSMCLRRSFLSGFKLASL